MRHLVRSMVLVAAAGVALPAFGQAINPINTRPSTVQPAPPGEGSLQSILDSVFTPGSVNATTSQSPFGMWRTATSIGTTIPTVVAEFTANAATQTFGIWFGTQTNSIWRRDLFVGGADRGDTVAIAIGNGTLAVTGGVDAIVEGGESPFTQCGTEANCGTWSNPLISNQAFGFYFRPTSTGPIYHSVDQLNAGPRSDRVLAFEGLPTNWVMSYEDGTDFDYNDMAVKVESITAVPEPSTMAMLAFGVLGLMSLAKHRRG